MMTSTPTALPPDQIKALQTVTMAALAYARQLRLVVSIAAGNRADDEQAEALDVLRTALESGARDRQRLDWLESTTATLSCDYGRTNPWHCDVAPPDFSVWRNYHGATARDAIDAAMIGEKK